MWAVLVVAAGLSWLAAVWGLGGALRGPGLVRRLQALAAGLVAALLAVSLTSVVVLLRAFDSFAGETLVATVRCHWVGPETFELSYLPSGAPAPAARTVTLRGDQWAIAGGLVKWHPWLTALGVPSYHRVMRLSGQYADLARQRQEPPTVEALAPGTDLVWEALYKVDPYVPFVQAAYGSAAFVYVEPGRLQQVYVTPSGYMIKRDARATVE